MIRAGLGFACSAAAPHGYTTRAIAKWYAKMTVWSEKEVENCLAQNGRKYVATKQIDDVIAEVCLMEHRALMDCKYCSRVDKHYLCMYEIMQYDW